MLEKLFQLKAHNTNVRTEILAGVTTFLAMAYILFVNPSILGETGMDKGAVFVATCLAAAIGSTVMGLIANYPIALAPGMGLNAFFTYTVVLHMGQGENLGNRFDGERVTGVSRLGMGAITKHDADAE